MNTRPRRQSRSLRLAALAAPLPQAEIEARVQAERSKRVCVARVGAAHGTGGEVRLWSFTADPVAVAHYGPLESADGERFEIEALRPGKGFLVARLKGIGDRTAAERLNNLALYVPRERLPELDAAGEYYHADLIGLAVMDGEGALRGRIVAIQNFGAGDLIEVELSAGGDTVFLPFTEAAVPVIDIAGARVLANPPAGIFSEDGDVPPPSVAPTRSAPKAKPR
jgi:16S rRNA processing protein RimM